MASSTPAPMKKFFAFVDENKDKFIDNLAEAVAIKSVSAWPEQRQVSFNEVARTHSRYFFYRAALE